MIAWEFQTTGGFEYRTLRDPHFSEPSGIESLRHDAIVILDCRVLKQPRGTL